MELPSHTYRCLCGEGIHIDPFQAGRLTRCPRCKTFVVVPSGCGDLAKEPVFDLTTGQLRLQLAARKHWREIHEIYSDERNFDYEICLPSSERETREAIKRSSFPSGFAKSSQLKFRISDLRDDRVVGTITVAFAVPYYSVCVGFMIRKDAQGKGYGTEALSAVCRLLHRDLNVERITAQCDVENRPCRAMLEKVGFKQEGFAERFFYHPDRGWVDSPAYVSLREPTDKNPAEQATAPNG